MLSHAIAVSPDVHDVAVVYEPVDECCRHYIVAKDLSPLLETFVRRQDGRGALVSAGHELKEEHRSGPADREIADLVDEEERGKDERFHPVKQSTSKLCSSSEPMRSPNVPRRMWRRARRLPIRAQHTTWRNGPSGVQFSRVILYNFTPVLTTLIGAVVGILYMIPMQVYYGIRSPISPLPG